MYTAFRSPFLDDDGEPLSPLQRLASVHDTGFDVEEEKEVSDLQLLAPSWIHSGLSSTRSANEYQSQRHAKPPRVPSSNSTASSREAKGLESLDGNPHVIPRIPAVVPLVNGTPERSIDQQRETSWCSTVVGPQNGFTPVRRSVEGELGVPVGSPTMIPPTMTHPAECWTRTLYNNNNNNNYTADTSEARKWRCKACREVSCGRFCHNCGSPGIILTPSLQGYARVERS